MAKKTVLVSDRSGNEIPEGKGATVRITFRDARKGYFEHDSANGTAFWRRIERFYPSRGFRSWTVGENLLWASDTYGAAFAVREWMNSPPHRANILSREWREIGIGAVAAESAPGEYHGRAVTIATADFGARS